MRLAIDDRLPTWEIVFRHDERRILWRGRRQGDCGVPRRVVARGRGDGQGRWERGWRRYLEHAGVAEHCEPERVEACVEDDRQERRVRSHRLAGGDPCIGVVARQPIEIHRGACGILDWTNEALHLRVGQCDVRVEVPHVLVTPERRRHRGWRVPRAHGFDEGVVPPQLVAVIAGDGPNAMHHQAGALALRIAAEVRVGVRETGIAECADDDPPRLGLMLQELHRRVTRVQYAGGRGKQPILPSDCPEIDCHERRQGDTERVCPESAAQIEQCGTRDKREEDRTPPCPEQQVRAVCARALGHDSCHLRRIVTALLRNGCPSAACAALSHAGQHSGGAEQRQEHAEGEPAEQDLPIHVLDQQPLRADGGQDTHRKREDVDDGAGRAEELGAGDEIVNELEERRAATEHPQQRYHERAEPEATERGACGSPERQRGEHEDGASDVFTVQVNTILPPILVQDAGELRHVHVQQLDERERVGRGNSVVMTGGAR